MPGATFHPGRHPIHLSLGGAFAPGAALASGVEVSVGVNLAGAARCRVRFKASHGGTLRLWARRPGTSTSSVRYTTELGNVVVVANTEATLDIAELFGEHAGDLAYTPSAGPGTVTFCDLAAV